MSLKIEREKRSVPLFKPEDRRELDELRMALQNAALADGPRRINDTDSPAKAAAAAHEEFKAKALKRATKVGITALRGQEWRNLLAAHPPRKDVLDGEGEVVESFPQDAEVGFNVDTIALPLVLASIDADQFDSDADRAEFVDDLSDPDFSRVFSQCVRVNTEGSEDPKWSASSWLEQTSAAISNSDESSD